MSKKKAPRKEADNEAKAVARLLRGSPRKLNLVAELIRGKDAGTALAELTFSKRRIAGPVKRVLQAAIANAENNHQLDVDRLVVAEAYVGGSFKLKRFAARAKGRGVRVEKKWSNLTVVVRENAEAEEKK
jgi:large subunit ribosomal protein L22